MRVHLIRSSEYSARSFDSIIKLLNRFQGPIEFWASETDFQIANAIEREIKDPGQFEIMHAKIMESRSLDRMSMFDEDISEREPVKFPVKEKTSEWDDFFNVCKNYRKIKNIPDNELVILLTDTRNDKNWFGAMDSTMRNVFIHAADWHYYFEGLHERFPIAYEIIVYVLRALMFDDLVELEKSIHHQSKGCMMDFCQDKKEIVLKVRTADICSDCFKIVEDKRIDRRCLAQIIETMEGVRKNFLSMERSAYLQQPSKIEIRGFSHQLFLPEYGDLEIHLNPKQKAIYCFYLRHPEGVRIVDLIDHRKEIAHYYNRFSNFSTLAEIEVALNTLLDPTNNNINEVLSKIKAAFTKALGDKIGKHYLITGQRGEKYAINLPQELISFCVD